jgi:hypothetical protein
MTDKVGKRLLKRLRKVDRCDICGQKLPKNYNNGFAFSCDAAAKRGQRAIIIQGHRICVKNVFDKIVTPNWLKVNADPWAKFRPKF